MVVGIFTHNEGGFTAMVQFEQAMMFLETERLCFRQHEAGDEADFIRLHMDPARSGLDHSIGALLLRNPNKTGCDSHRS
jgi:hypothetical protein